MDKYLPRYAINAHDLANGSIPTVSMKVIGIAASV